MQAIKLLCFSDTSFSILIDTSVRNKVVAALWQTVPGSTFYHLFFHLFLLSIRHRLGLHTFLYVTDWVCIPFDTSQIGSAYLSVRHRLGLHTFRYVTDWVCITFGTSQTGSAYLSVRHRLGLHTNTETKTGMYSLRFLHLLQELQRGRQFSLQRHYRLPKCMLCAICYRNGTPPNFGYSKIPLFSDLGP